MKATTRLVGVLAIALLLPGCKLIFEPPEDCLARLFEALVSKDYGAVERLLDDPAMMDDLRVLAAAFNSPLYKGKTGYWKTVEVEVDEETGLTYAFVEVEVPQPSPKGSRKAIQSKYYEIVFEMERNWLVWTIYYIEDIDILLKAIDRAQTAK
ncbi:MAG: hypothetical protein RBU37_16555 [Myxococcota bacterium]|jgi:hypothetical protein|nr:hypothetical protein [Myxococcota bacterium]